jgi:zinc-finger of transposase IS204/IS1001/IS1096/IS1165
MAWADLLPQFPHLQIHSIQQECQHVTITLVSTRESDQCPICQTHTQAGHGWFTRRIHGLPCSGQAVVFLIQGRRFRCSNLACPRKTFREDLSALADRYQRRTQAVTQLLCSMAAIAGGQAGVRLAAQMQLPTSRSTLLRCLIRQTTCPEGVPRVVGVDDFGATRSRTCSRKDSRKEALTWLNQVRLGQCSHVH